MAYWFGIAKGVGGTLHPVAFDERPSGKHPFARDLVPGSLVEVPPDLRGASLEYLMLWAAEQKAGAEPAPDIVEPERQPVITTLTDAGMLCAELAMTIRSAGQRLARAIEDGHDPIRAKQIALGTLRTAHEDLARLLEDIATVPASDGEFRP